ncbi:MAG: hypothetical protein A4E35_01496 [Methanoregula sp. PtaU1.Bin051]|nr:MAG: hypothetical protein A4E35_01496 [Methanoregula sp. PtaU1.Bin051]
MRRIYYRFPQRIDLTFTLGLPFHEAIRHIVTELDGAEKTKTTGKELVKVKSKVEIAIDRATFGDVTPDILKPGAISEAADFRISVLALALRGGSKVPIANDVFLVRLTDRIKHTDIEIAKESGIPGLDALDIKNLILGKS